MSSVANRFYRACFLVSPIIGVFFTGCATTDDISPTETTQTSESALSARNNRNARLSPPNLKTQRKEHRHERPHVEKSTSSRISDSPVPGGLGAGVSFQTGALKVQQSATLYTHMVVYPEGLGQLPNWLYTTSTNRTEKGVEVVGMYINGPGAIGVFDWSCSVEDPCSNGSTSPSWIWAHDFASQPCQIANLKDGRGIEHESMYYANTTRLVGDTWTNEVTFWNYCTNDWDLVYSHNYHGSQKDCSFDSSCGWWGPIIENFFPLDDTTPLPELGFFETSLVHDGTSSRLPESETSWSAPPTNWDVCYRFANSSWSTTNQSCTSTNSLSATAHVDADWNSGYCATVTVSNSANTPVNSWKLNLDLHESQRTDHWNAIFTLNGNSQYTVTPQPWTQTVGANQSVSFGFCATKTGGNYAPTVTVL
jgi:hypothetical protein